MLRCPPSRINLTSSDLHGLDQRMAARHSARNAGRNTSNVRLSPGPGHPTRLSIVSAERNIGRDRAASSSSEATFHAGDVGQYDESLPITIVDNTTDASELEASTNVRRPCLNQSTLHKEAARVAERVVQQRQTAEKHTGYRDVDSSYNPSERSPTRQENGSDDGLPVPLLDGSLELRTSQISLRAPGNAVLNADARQNHGQYPTDHRVFSTARPNWQVARNHEVDIYNDSEDRQEFICRRHVEKPALSSRDAVRAPHPVPELIFETEAINSLSPNPTLDPGAPVFIPRTRFGSATESYTEGNSSIFLESPWAVGDSAHSSTNLRIRPSSEQNIDNPARLRLQASHRSPSGETVQQTGITTRQRHRHTSRTADWNAAVPALAPNLERYPVIGSDAQRRSSGRPIPQASLVPSVTFHQNHTPNTTASRQLSLHVRHAFLSSGEETRGRRHPARSVSPAVSVGSRSTPNLLQAPRSASRIDSSRASSLSWSQRTSSLPRVPSMVSAASGVSGGTRVDGQPSRHSSREGVNAAAEFLRMRNSPLDDLTERLSRLSSGQPRSIGRSWERNPQSGPRVSLLTGDPFRQETSSSDHLPAESTEVPEHISDSIDHSTIEEESEAEDAVALSLALPPSSPPPQSMQAIPSTPPLYSKDVSSPRTALAQKSPARVSGSPESAIKRKPVPASAVTPKVQVYDDKKPPNAQPQTPADVTTRYRRPKTRSDTTTHQSPVLVGRAMISSPPAIPERNPYRNTYPPLASTHTGQASMVESGRGITSRSEPTNQARTRRRAQTRRSGEQTENDLEGQLDDLEQDRRTWLSRRDTGTMEVTPPREGRFERYYHAS